MTRRTLDEENLIDTTGIADRDFADHSGNIQHGYELGSLTRGLVAYYPMEEGQGQVLHDGALNNLGQINGASWNGSGQVGNDALSFDGSNDDVDTGISSLSAPLTISAYVLIDDKSSDGAIFANFASTNSDVYLLYDSGNDVFNFNADSGSGTAGSGVSTTQPTTGVWYLVTAVVNSNGDRILYVDGVEENRNNDSTTEYSTSNNFHIGQRGDDVWFWNGNIDDVRIYDRALSQPEIEALYNLSSPSGFEVTERDVPTLRKAEYDLGGAVSRYPFNGSVADVWADNDGTDNTSAGYVDGVFGQAKDFDGTDDDIPTGIDMTEVQTPSVSFWFNPDDLSSAQRIVNDWVTSTDESFSFTILPSSNVIRYQIEESDGTNRETDIDISEFSTGNWYHLCGSYDGSKQRVYLNGELEDSLSWSGTLGEGSSNLRFGNGSGLTNWYDGALDDVRIYDRALDPSEVEQLYNKGAYRIKRGEL